MEWLTSVLLPYVVPVLVQVVTPLLIGYLKIVVGYLDKKLPHGVIVALAGVVAEGLNAAQAHFTGNPLPYGLGGTLAILFREIRTDFAKAASS